MKKTLAALVLASSAALAHSDPAANVVPAQPDPFEVYHEMEQQDEAYRFAARVAMRMPVSPVEVELLKGVHEIGDMQYKLVTLGDSYMLVALRSTAADQLGLKFSLDSRIDPQDVYVIKDRNAVPLEIPDELDGYFSQLLQSYFRVFIMQQRGSTRIVESAKEILKESEREFHENVLKQGYLSHEFVYGRSQETSQ